MKINGRHNAAALADEFARNRRMHIRAFLDDADARALHAEIAAHRSWNFTIFAHGAHRDLDGQGWEKLDAAAKQKTVAIVHERANHEFAYMHYKFPIYDRYHSGGELTPQLRAFFEFLNSAPFLDFARTLTGARDISFADAQLTAMGPGHFITVHNDDLEGKNRRAAFVFNITPQWREDWGGYLNFFNPDGHLAGGYKPAFNALNIFAVPALHSVGVVAPFARKRRIVISGWLRAGADPAVAR